HLGNRQRSSAQTSRRRARRSQKERRQIAHFLPAKLHARRPRGDDVTAGVFGSRGVSRGAEEVAADREKDGRDSKDRKDVGVSLRVTAETLHFGPWTLDRPWGATPPPAASSPSALCGPARRGRPLC